jgi:acyl carrier protein
VFAGARESREQPLSDILAALNQIFADVIDETDVVLKRETTARDVDDWDSLNHIQFIVAIEKHFKIKFTRAEIASWKDVGAMCDAIAGKIGA